MKRRTFVQSLSALMAASPLYRCGSPEKKGPKIVIAGFDGASWETIDPLIQSNRLPFLKRLVETGAWGPLATIKPAKSHVVWTSIATGKTMMKHGILDFAYLRKNNIQVPYTQSERKAPALWEILDAYFGMRSVVLNWFVTHPPPQKMNGVMVTDRFRKAAQKRWDSIERFSDSVYPPQMFDKLADYIETDYHRALEETGVPDYLALFVEKNPDLNPRRVPVISMFPLFIRQDATMARITSALFDTVSWDCFATYFRLPDIVQHFVWELLDNELKGDVMNMLSNGVQDDVLITQAYGQVADLMAPVYRFMERVLKGMITTASEKNIQFYLMSDHGFSFYPGGYNHVGLPDTQGAPAGIFMVNGSGVRPGYTSRAAVYDVAPTILNQLDLPVGKNMDGRALTELFSRSRRIRYRPYSLGEARRTRRDRDYDRENLEELRSLGYIGD